jgi:hypothetical protein
MYVDPCKFHVQTLVKNLGVYNDQLQKLQAGYQRYIKHIRPLSRYLRIAEGTLFSGNSHNWEAAAVSNFNDVQPIYTC